MTEAGRSAARVVQREMLLLEDVERATQTHRTKISNYAAAEVSEIATFRALLPLEAHGYTLLADRRWPGTRDANVDLLAIGPGGVFIIDTKFWAEAGIHGGRLYRGQADMTEELSGLMSLARDSHDELASSGISPNEIHPVIALHERSGVNVVIEGVRVLGQLDLLRWISDFGIRHDEARVARLVAVCEEFFLPFDDEPAPPSDRKETAQPPTSPAYGSPLQDSLFSDAEVQEAMTKAVLKQDIEDWMAFLHPTQAKLVSRHFNGPARIRGGAGTGKTVVGLHRAAYLARMYPGCEVLMTTYVKNLPDVMRSLLQRIAPDAADRVRCINVDKLAKQILEDRGHEVKLFPKVTNQLLTQAWREVGSKGPLGALGLVERYWEEEIRSVIKGRGITEFDHYAELRRIGRKQRLTKAQREEGGVSMSGIRSSWQAPRTWISMT